MLLWNTCWRWGFVSKLSKANPSKGRGGECVSSWLREQTLHFGKQLFRHFYLAQRLTRAPDSGHINCRNPLAAWNACVKAVFQPTKESWCPNETELMLLIWSDSNDKIHLMHIYIYKRCESALVQTSWSDVDLTFQALYMIMCIWYNICTHLHLCAHRERIAKTMSSMTRQVILCNIPRSRFHYRSQNRFGLVFFFRHNSQFIAL